MTEDQAKLIICVVGCILVALGFLVLCICLGIAEIRARGKVDKTVDKEVDKEVDKKDD